ncbi:MAG TPA: pitrilysin family protein [Myxococcaceae bacterium]|nr:pitrilysin family protein [Myxococcaceae bacterium]
MPARHRLPNGLTVVHEPIHAARVVAFQIWVQVGSADEAPDEAGLAHLHEHMLFKGTTRRGPGQVARDIERHGGEVNAWTSFDHTVYHAVMASDFARVGLDVLADAVRDPTFDAGELAREVEVVVEEIKRADDTPARRASRDLFAQSYSRHPYRLPVLGTQESVRSVTRERITGFYRRHYLPESMVLVAVGDVEQRSLLAWAEELLGGDWGRGRPAPRRRPAEPARTGRRMMLRPDEVVETHLHLSFAAPAVDHEDVPALDVLAMLAGSGEASRLLRAVKRERQLVNEISAYAYTPLDPGLFGVGFTSRGETTRDALRATAEVLAGLAAEPCTAAELDTLKALIESEAVYQRETVQGQARKLGFYETSLGGFEAEARYLAKVAALTPEAVQDAARRTLDLDRVVVTALLPPSTPLAEADAAEALDAGLRSPRTEPTPRPPVPRASPSTSPSRQGEVSSVRVLPLPGGTTLVVREEHAVPLVALRAVFPGGLRVESEAENGIGALVARLLTKGAGGRSAEQMVQEVDSLSGALGGAAGRNSLSLRGEFLSRHFDRAFALFADCLRAPAFAEEEVARERHLQLQEIRARDDRPANLAFDLFARTLFQRHPYRFPVSGERASVEALHAGAVRAYHGRFLGPGAMTLAVIGDVDADQVVRRAEAAFASAGERRALPEPAPEPPPAERRSVHRVLPRAQVNLVLGFQGLRVTDPDRHALAVLTTVLSGQGGRLFVELRDRRSMAYSVSCVAMEGVDPGHVAVYIGTSPDKSQAALAGIEAELRRIAEEPVGDDELDRARAHIIGSHEISLQRNSARAALLALDQCYGLGLENFLHLPERVRAVTAADVQRVARALLRLDRSALAVVGP